MTLMLAGKSLVDIVKLPLPLYDGRLNVSPNALNQVYEIIIPPTTYLVHYRLDSATPEFEKFGMDIGKRFGTIGSGIHGFIDFSGNYQEFHAWIVTIWEGIPSEFRDILFFHEVVELDGLARGLPQPEAHKIASSAHEAYLKKYLSAEERERFEKTIRKLELLAHTK